MDSPIVLEKAIEKAYSFIAKDYRSELAVCAKDKFADEGTNFSLWKIESLSYEEDENHIDKISNVYNVLAGTGATVFLFIRGGEKNEMYLGVKMPIDANAPGRAARSAKLHANELKAAFAGNFPGSRICDIDADVQREIIASIADKGPLGAGKAVCAVNGTPGMRAKHGEPFMQGMERFMDAMGGQRYSFLYIAESMTSEELEAEKLAYEDLYSQLSPFATCDVSMGESQTLSLTNSLGESISQSVGKSIQVSHGTSRGKTQGTSIKKNMLHGIWTDIFGGKSGGSVSVQDGENDSRSIGGNVNTGRVETQNEARTNASGRTSSRQIKFQNKYVQDMMEKLDATLKRIRTFEHVSAWRGGAYFIATSKPVAMQAALTYRALMSGGDSVLEPLCINSWVEDTAEDVVKALSSLNHPSFSMPKASANYGAKARTCTIVSGTDLALMMGMPLKSVEGVAVSRFVPFAREVQLLENVEAATPANSIALGQVFHMGATTKAEARMNLRNITEHIFITGTPGSGKSTTVYRIIDELASRNVKKRKGTGIKFLIIEPAKGEYKNVFGGREDVTVFTIGGKIGTFLAFNPFRFPEGTSVEVHISRIVDIFNACWQMYAAMPSILKRAIVRIYEDRGWDLVANKCYGPDPFPTFADLLEELPRVVEESEFSAELKGNYTGALVERVRDLTEGIEREIFLANNFVDEDRLLGENAIVDLSEGISDDARALIMGFLVLKMEERYKSLCGEKDMNLPLQHVTILEEAHCLLRKTSTAQSADGANVQGKAVQMITSAIRQMRTYGEGFIIVDQSPAALDESVMSCAGTKIVHRLPSVSDYTMVGRSMSLSEEQLPELSRLGTGVAAVIQGGWASCALVKIFPFGKERYKPCMEAARQAKGDTRETVAAIIKALLVVKCGKGENEVQWLQEPRRVKNMLEYVDSIANETVRKFLASNMETFVQKGFMPCWKMTEQSAMFDCIQKLLPSVRVAIPAIKDEKSADVEINKLRMRLRAYANFDGDEICENNVLSILICVNKNAANASSADVLARKIGPLRHR